jgi:LPS sulfotransferase NodH
MGQRIICITAGQRAGTTALQRAIAQGGAARSYGEIFQIKHDSASGRRRSFHAFAREKAIALADVMQPDGAGAMARQYLDWLKEGAGPRHVLMDVKLNSWLAVSPAWQYPHEEPFFLKCLKRERAIFIFLWRRSLAEQILSLFISRELGIWHNLTPEKVANRRLTAPIGQLERLASMMCRSESDMREHLNGYPDKIVISYEELYCDAAIGDTFRAAFRSLTGIELSAGPLQIRPNDVDKRDVVTNYDQAAAAIDSIAARYRPRGTERPDRAVARLIGLSP